MAAGLPIENAGQAYCWPTRPRGPQSPILPSTSRSLPERERESAEHHEAAQCNPNGQMLPKHDGAGQDADEWHQESKRRDLVDAISLHKAVPDRVRHDVTANSQDDDSDPYIPSSRPEGFELPCLKE